ncbi:MAG: hypothetical protein IPP22_05970 [Nitrosomonas sp.]|nr:hypothetical protein [Nitrosomonas sp.]
MDKANPFQNSFASQRLGRIGPSPDLNNIRLYACLPVFEAPTTTELLNNPAGRGGFNPNLNAQTSLSNELVFA